MAMKRSHQPSTIASIQQAFLGLTTYIIDTFVLNIFAYALQTMSIAPSFAGSGKALSCCETAGLAIVAPLCSPLAAPQRGLTSA